MNRIVILTLAALALTSLAHRTSRAQTPPNPSANQVELELRVQRLLQELDTGTGDAREAAEQQLLSIGEAVLPLLPEITPSTSAETKERLTRIRESLNRTAVREALEASRLTLQGDFTFAELLQQIEQQTGNRIIDYRERFGQQASRMKLNVDFDNLPFWPALDSLLDQADLTTYSYTGEPRALGVVAASGNQQPRSASAAYAGAFRIEATEIQAHRNLRNAVNTALRIRLETMWEPRILPILIRQPFQDVELIADDGSQIEVASADGVAEVPVQSTVAGIELVLPLQLPDRSVQRITRLRGRMFAVVPGREETFEFANLGEARNVSQQRGGLRVTLERVRRNGSVYEFRIRLELLNRDVRFESHLDWASNNVVYLVNNRGEKVDNPNFERYLEQERAIGYGYLFPLPDDLSDYRLVYRSPAALLTLPIEYELRNIPLP